MNSDDSCVNDHAYIIVNILKGVFIMYNYGDDTIIK